MRSTEILKIIREQKDALARLGVHQLGLFGSHVRGEASADSDIDFVVEFIQEMKNYDNFSDLCFLLEDLFGDNIDVLTKESLSPHLRENILKETRFEIIH